MNIRKASEVLEEQMYSDTRLAIEIQDAANDKKTQSVRKRRASCSQTK